MGSFQSVHSNAIEKNKVLSTLLQHGVETTVDRTQKNSRIINWIQNGRTTDPAEQLELQSKYADRKSESLSSSGVGSDEVHSENFGKNQKNSESIGAAVVKTTATTELTSTIAGSIPGGEASCTDDVDSGNYHQ